MYSNTSVNSCKLIFTKPNCLRNCITKFHTANTDETALDSAIEPSVTCASEDDEVLEDDMPETDGGRIVTKLGAGKSVGLTCTTSPFVLTLFFKEMMLHRSSSFTGYLMELTSLANLDSNLDLSFFNFSKLLLLTTICNRVN